MFNHSEGTIRINYCIYFYHSSFLDTEQLGGGVLKYSKIQRLKKNKEKT